VAIDAVKSRYTRISTLADLMVQVESHFRLTDPYVIEVVFAVLATVTMPGDPAWTFLVGPPSSLKTEIVRWFRGLPKVYTTSRLTPHSLVSGLKGGDSLLPQLDGKVLMIKDFTAILEMDRKAREEIFAQLRDAFDGYYEGHFGSIGKLSFVSHFSVLAAVTSAIEEYYSVQSFLGPRFLKARVPALDGFDKSVEEGGREDELRRLFSGLVEKIAASIGPDDWRRVSFSRVLDLKPIVQHLALGRTHVSRSDGFISQVPEPEMLPRLTKQLKKLAIGRAVLYGRTEVDESDIAFLRRIAHDTLPRNRAAIIDALGTPCRVESLVRDVHLPKSTLYRHLEELMALGLVDTDGAAAATYSCPATPHFYGKGGPSIPKEVGGAGVPPRDQLQVRLSWLRSMGFDDSDPAVSRLRQLLSGPGG